MGKVGKFLLYGIISLVLIVIVAAVAVIMLVNPNDYKDKITEVVKKQTGRELVIEGDLKLSLFPWIGLQTGKLVLGNAPGFGPEPFAALEEADIKVKLLPLFSKRVEVKHIVLKGLDLNLEKNPKGITNWEDLTKAQEAKKKVKPPTEQAPPETKTALPALAVGGFTLQDATVVWNDRQAGKKIRIDNLNARLDALKFGEPTDFTLGFVLQMNEPPLKETISLTTDLVIAENLKQFELNHLKLKSHSEGKSIPSGRLDAALNASISLDMDKQTLAVSGLKLEAAKVTLNGNLQGKNIIDNPQISGKLKALLNPKQTLSVLAIEAPKTQDANALEKVEIALDLLADRNSLALKNLLLLLDQTQMKGHVNVSNFADPNIMFDLEADGIDVDRYLPPPSGAPQIKEENPVQPAAKQAPESGELPLAAVAGLNLDGKIHIGSVKVKGLKMQDVSLTARGKDKKMTIKPVIGKLYQGHLNSVININARGKTPTLAISEKMDKVQIQPLLKDLTGKDYLAGTTVLTTNLTTRGKDVESVKRNLNGKINFHVKDGSLNNVEIFKLIKQGEAWWKGKGSVGEEQINKLRFVGLNFLATVRNGVVNTDEFLIDSRKIRIEGTGTIDLVREQLDYRITALRLKHKEEAGKEVTLAKGMPIIIKVTGPLSKPRYMLDVVQMAYEKNKRKIEKTKEKIEKKVVKKLEKKLGKELGGQAGEVLEKGIGGALKGLFGK